MPIQENALNSALAEALSAYDLHATPEQTRAKSGAKRCDVQIRRRHGDRYFTALECKIGQSATQRQAAIRDAQRWLKQSDCWNALALCYPEELSEDRQATPRQILEVTRDLVRQANWQKVGGASPLERRSNRTTFLREPCVGSREGAGEASVAAWMGRAIEHRKSDGPGCRGFQIGRRQYRRRRFGEMSASPAVSENPCTFARLLLGPWEVFKLPRLS